MGDRRGMAWEWGYLGLAYGELRRFDEAIGCLQQAVAIHREVRDRYTEGWTLDYLGLALQHARGMDAARACWQEARTILTELGVLEANEVRIRLEGDVLHYGRQRFIAVGAVEATSLNRWSLLVGGRTYPRQPVP